MTKIQVDSNGKAITLGGKVLEAVGGSPVISPLNVTPTTLAQTITAPSGTDGYSPINVSAVTSSIDDNITSENIKKDVSILGVTGTYEGSSATLITKNITQNGTYNASADNADGYSSVTVNVPSSGGIGITREVSANGVYQMPTSSFTFSLPSNATDLGNYAIPYAFSGCTGLTSVDLSSLTTINGLQAMNYAFQNCTSLKSVDLSNLTTITGSGAMSYTFSGCTGLTSVDLSSLTAIRGVNGMYYTFQNCSGLTSVDLSNLTTLSLTSAMYSAFQNCTGLISIDLSSLTTLSGTFAMYSAFQNCSGLASVDLSNLTTISGTQAMVYAFRDCISLTSILFPALTSTSFGSVTNQFNKMLQGVTGCTVHFPSNLQSVIGSWSDVTAGFGGTNTTVLFDLPATT